MTMRVLFIWKMCRDCSSQADEHLERMRPITGNFGQ